MARILLALLFFLKVAAVYAQAPPPVPALPDTERRTSYNIVTSTCNCAVNFALYGDGTDYQDWVEVWLNGVQVQYNDPSHGWSITSSSGTIGSIALPITDAILTFNSAQTGAVQIVGARRPRRVSQFNENQGIPARALNQTLNDIVAQNREEWDKTNDLTGRGLFFAPGNTTGPMPPAIQCENSYLAFDATGLNPVCVLSATQPTLPLAVPNGGTGNTTFTANLPLIGNGAGAIAQGTISGNTTTFATTTGTLTSGHCVSINSGNLVDAGGACTTGGGGGTVSSGTAGQLALYASSGTTVSGTNSGPAPVWIGAYGAKCDGSTDDTTAIQNAWNAAAALNADVYLGGVGTVCVISSLTIPAIQAPQISGYGRQSMLFGPSQNAVVLKSTVTGSSCAITVSATYASNSFLSSVMRGFSLIQTSGSQLGYGVCLTNITHLTVTNMLISGFAHGIHAVDCININVEKNNFTNNQDHIEAIYSSNSHPNLWRIRDNWFAAAAQYSIFMVSPDGYDIRSNAFESNGTNSGLSPDTIYILGLPIDGRQGGIIDSNYFESNGGTADIVFDYNSVASTNSIYSVSNNTFQRDLTKITDGILIANNGSGSASVDVRNNSFYDFQAPSGTNQYITPSTPAATNWAVLCEGNLFTGGATELAHVACAPSVAANPGYITEGGFYREWGTVVASVGGTAVTFPIACPNAALSVVIGTQNGASPSAVSVGGVTTAGFSAYAGGAVAATWSATCR